jgi:putative lipoic acid-binding regulatory protein
METVTGQAQLRTKSVIEVERFVQEHLAELEDHEISIRHTSTGDYLAEFYSTKEPT